MVNEIKRGKLLKRAGLVILMGACAMLMSASQVSALIIDHFDSGDFAIVEAYNSGALPNNSGVFSQVGTVNLIQNNRSDQVIVTGPSTGGSGNSTLRVQQTGTGSLPSILRWDEDDGLFGTVMVDYHGAGSTFVPAVDLTDAGASKGFTFSYGTDTHSVKLTLDVFSAGGKQSEVVTTLAGTPATNVMVLGFIPFASFSVISGGGAVFSAATEVKYTFDSTGQPGGDYYFDQFGTGNPVPEPLTMLGMVFGLGSVGAYIRKRRMA